MLDCFSRSIYIIRNLAKTQSLGFAREPSRKNRIYRKVRPVHFLEELCLSIDFDGRAALIKILSDLCELRGEFQKIRSELSSLSRVL
jgi:hypothetical protein